jgi:hypothetical protein
VHRGAKQIDLEVVARGRELARQGILLALDRNFLPANWNAWIFERFPALTDSPKPDDATSQSGESPHDQPPEESPEPPRGAP